MFIIAITRDSFWSPQSTKSQARRLNIITTLDNSLAMEKFNFNPELYLNRIGLSVPPDLDKTGLVQLHQAQFFSIPFENFDIQMGKSILLDPEHLFQKLVLKKRGGYCFELNGLLAMALKHFGFNVRPLLARVHLAAEPSGRTHLLNLVELENGPWIIDAGFGAGGLRSPLPLKPGVYEHESGYSFSLEKRAPWGWMMRTLDKGLWKDSYSFDLEHVTKEDIDVGNFYTSHSPNTHFTQIRTASKPTAKGRISIRNFTFTCINGEKVETSQVEDGPGYLDFLEEHFDIRLDTEYENLKKINIE